MAKITINGKEITADNNKTLLEVVRENNLADIPTLCHSEFLDPFTSCFLCVVEVEGARTLSPACATQVREGMVVHLDSERVLESRKMNLELLLSNHNADCYPPCRLKCPANMDIQGYIALASRGLLKEGQKLMKETNPLTMICGRVCARPCEDDCRRQYVDEAVDIKNIKRYMADIDLASGDVYVPETGPDTGKKVAIIGSGPAGLSAAYFLRQYGHGAAIFERLPEAGGMMRYGIPEYRLPKADLKKEIDSILGMGVDIKFNTELGKDMTIDSLFDSGYDAVFLGIGAQLGSSMGTKGEDLEGVMQGVDFLLDVNLGKDVKLDGKVFVVGGGNTAIDAARSALRVGAASVSIVYRRTEAEMPAHHEEIEDAKDEGIELMVLNNPVEYIGENGKLKAVKLIKMELGEPDDSGRRRPVPIKGSEYEVDVDHVIEAVGQKIDTTCLDGVDVTKWNTIIADENLFTTNRKGVFAGGDAVTGPSIIISAVAHGRKAAKVIDEYLRGEELKAEDRLGFYVRKEDFAELTEDDFKDKIKLKRNHIQKEPAEDRKRSFIEVEKGFTEEDFQKETYRCMECGCQDIYECKLKDYSFQYNADKTKFIGGEYKKNLYDSKHKFIDVNTEKCVNCGQCIRLCSMVQKQAVFSFDKRGFNATVVPFMYKALDETNCISCGTCVTGCPVGAIVEKMPKGDKPGPFDNRLTETFCTLCGDVCKIVVETRDGNFIKISSKIKNKKFFDNLCEKGRFGYEKYIKRKLPDLSENSVDEINNFLKKADSKKTLLAISPELTIEEIDQALSFSEKKGLDTYSFELASDAEKLSLFNGKGLKIVNDKLKDLSSYKNIYYFGSFDESHNSVSFRKIIMNDKEQNIYLSSGFENKYFDCVKFDSDEELFKHLSENYSDGTFIVFNLQKTDADVLDKLAGFITEKKIDNYSVLNNYPNYQYLLEKMSDINNIKSKIESGAYDTLIMVNSNEDLLHGDYKEKLVFSDKDVAVKADHIVPINSIYEKGGTIIDQTGQSKMLVKCAKERAENLNRFFQYTDHN